MVTEAETLEAMVNRYKRQAKKHADLARMLMEQVQRLEEVRRVMAMGEEDLLSSEPPVTRLVHEPGLARGAVTEGLKEYLRATGIQQFTPANAVAYLRERLQVQNSKELYNSAYRALTRMVEKGELSKEGEQFTVAHRVVE